MREYIFLKRLFIIIVVTFSLTSCSRIQEKADNKLFYEEFYSVLNDLILLRLPDVSVIKYETMPVYKTQWDTIPIYKYSIPPPPEIHCIDINSFNTQIERKHLDSIDAKYMYDSIDSLKILKIDSNRVYLPVMTEPQFKEIFVPHKSNGYNFIKAKYGSPCFIIVSTPVFNSKYTKVIISIDYRCAPLAGQGFEFVLEKRGGKWNLIDENVIWVSELIARPNIYHEKWLF
jgi:hypothetical protein